MPTQNGLVKYFPQQIRERGEEYFSTGCVTELREEADETFRASVQGNGAVYDVAVRLDGTALDIECSCPYFSDRAQPCKHIWAVILDLDQRGSLPPEIRQIELYVDDARPAPRSSPRKVTQPERWRHVFAALPRRPHRREPSQLKLPESIGYAIATGTNVSPSFGAFLHVMGRSTRRDGSLSPWRRVQIPFEALELLPPFDRDTLGLLFQKTSGGSTEAQVTIGRPALRWWIERLARAEQLLVLTERGDYEPVDWDDGGPWRFHLDISHDAAAGAYVVEGKVRRDGDEIPLKDVQIAVPGAMIARNVACLLEGGETLGWIDALKRSGAVSVPERERDEFRRVLLQLPLGEVTLPPELGWDVESVQPVPRLSLQGASWSTELLAQLSFLYGEVEINYGSNESYRLDGRRLVRRDRQKEQAHAWRLQTLPVTATVDGFRVRLAYLEQVITALASEGWRVDIDGAQVRLADDYEIDVASGIDWFDLKASARFGSQRLAIPELLKASSANKSFLRLTDGTVAMLPKAWIERFTTVAEFGTAEKNSIRFKKAQAILIESLLRAESPLIEPAFAAIRSSIPETAPAARQEPETFLGELRGYQREGLGWLHFLRDAGIGGCLADDMGLGKTVQLLALLESIRTEKTAPSLIVAPRSLLFNWKAEAERFTPQLRVLEYHGSERAKAVERFEDFDIVLTTYATMRLDIEHLVATEFEYVILDEAQAIKNGSSQVAKASWKLRGRHRVALSGTPIENHLGELWSIFHFLNPGMLGPARTFNRTFASKSTPVERREALARGLRPLILRRTKEQVAPELPERIEQTLYCQLEGKQKEQYDELREYYRASLLPAVRSRGVEGSQMHVLEALLRLRQAACHPALIDPGSDAASAKMELLLDEIFDVVESGHRALVFSQFTSFLDIVKRELDKRKIAYAYLDGRTRNREEIVRGFQSDDGPPLFLISLKAGGLGLNLTNADYVFLLDPWWNPAVEAQAIDRAHRIGRTRSVIAYRLIARDTVEEKILELQSRKREIAESIISEDNSVLRKLEIEDLEMLLG